MLLPARPAELPPIRVRIHSRNPFAMVSAIRTALRRSDVDRDRIASFTDEALSQGSPGEIRRFCESWADFVIPG